jgi:hypothetical protein
MSNAVITLICRFLLAAVLAGCSSMEEPKVCEAGCLCFTTPETCPAGCYPSHQKTDAGSVFSCSNGPPDAGVAVPSHHRAAGSICPQDRGPGISDVGDSCPVPGLPAPGCTGDTDCAAGVNGRCLEFGGPACNYDCTFDQCTRDSDCPGDVPCACRSTSSDSAPNVCATASNCRVDADCGAAGFCSPSLVNNPCQCFSESFCAPGSSGCTATGVDGATKQVRCSCGGNCGHGYFCHTPTDSCLDDSDCAGGICTFDLNSQVWLCASGCIGPL